jgi:hypothetical protein
MNNLLLIPVKFLGWTAVGLALGVGWKLGSHLAGVAMGEETLLDFPPGKRPVRLKPHLIRVVEPVSEPPSPQA